MEYNEDILLKKLDEFIRKFYKNQLVRGLIYSTGLFLGFYLLIALLESFAHFDTTMRTILFYSFIAGILGVFGRYILIPLFKLNKIGAIISNEQAAGIIGKHFSEVKDKLLNVLQLRETASALQGVSAYTGRDLLEASINQKIKELKPVPFASAIDLRQNRRHLKYAIAPLVVILFIIFSAPSLITESTKRLMHHGEFYEKKAPFHFTILNGDMKAVEQQDFPLSVKITGEEIPENVFLQVNGNEYKLTRENIVNFSYIFKNMQHTTKFKLSADGYTSAEYEIRVLPNPVLLNFEIHLDYPAYLGKKNEVLRNTGDLVIPAGTKVSWSFNTKDTRILHISFTDTSYTLNPSANACFYSNRFLKSNSYSVTTSNEFMKSKDSVVYAISVIPDLYPSIQVEEHKDSMSTQHLYYRGEVKDDYGFTGLNFNYKFTKKEDSASATPGQGKYESVRIPVSGTFTQDQFMYVWDLTKLNVAPGDQIEYFFEVWDNDGVHGAKSTRTQKMLFKAPTLKELAEKSEDANRAVKSDISETVKEAKELQKDIDDMHKKVMEKKSLNWEDKKKIQELLDKEKNLEKNIEQFKQQNEKNQKEQSDYRKNDEKLLEKQKQIQDLFDKLMTEDMKKQMQELEKLMQTMDKDKMQDQLEKMKLSNKDLEKELDRTLELFKQMEFDKKLTETKERLDKLAEDQQKLSEKAEQKKADSKELENKQEQLNKEMEDVKKEMEDLEKKNNELEKPHEDFKNMDKQEQEIQKDMKQSSQELENKDTKKASKSQSKASKEMKELSQKMGAMQQQMMEEQNEEDMNALRQILENLVHLSFAQEALMGDLGKTRTDNPQYTKIAQNQKKLKDDAKMIEDSLFALSKRNPMIGAIVNKESSAINSSMDKAITHLAERQSGEAASRQQYAMTSINNLALLLNEALSAMQEMKKQGKPGAGSCNKPGGKGQKQSAASLRQMQQALNNRMGEMMKKMKGGQGQSGMSEEFARMAAQQEAIREMLQKIGDQLKKDGKGGGNLGNTSQKMDETETDLVNKRITQETIKRQQEILNKMLDYEKAEKEREMDTQRKAEQPKNQEFSNPNDFLEYSRLKAREVELLKTVPPSLSPYYKSKVSEYFNSFEEK